MAHIHHSILRDIKRFELCQHALVAVNDGIRFQAQLRMLGLEELKKYIPCLGAGVPGLIEYVSLPVRSSTDYSPDHPTQDKAFVSPCLMIL